MGKMMELWYVRTRIPGSTNVEGFGVCLPMTLPSVVQDLEKRIHLFNRFPYTVHRFVAHLKAHNAFVCVKPSPLLKQEMVAIAEDATCGATTILYGRTAAYLKHLSGVRNPSISAWVWDSIRFLPIIIVGSDKKTEEVRPLWLVYVEGHVGTRRLPLGFTCTTLIMGLSSRLYNL